MIQTSLFSSGPVVRPLKPDWEPPEPPDLSDEKDLFVDTEGTGLRWWGDDRITGISVATQDGRSWYLPYRHASQNLGEGAVLRWAQRELRGKNISFFNAPHDINFLLKDGIDLEAQGCTVSDAGHWAALLNDHRYTSSLDSISREYLGYGKKDKPFSDKVNMADLPAGNAEEYARWDATLVAHLRAALWPRMGEEGLQRVRQLEDDCLFATAEMMRNGAPLDEELLDQWLRQSEADYVKCLYDLYRAVGFKVNPASTKDLRLVFDRCGLEYPTNEEPNTPDTGKVTFAKMYLARIDHPVIRTVRRAKRLSSLRAKYLIPYREDLRRNGVLRYALHQLRAGSDDPRDEDSGTISGRYSSSAYKTGDGANIQQVSGKKFAHSVKEEKDWPYQVRKLFVPRDRRWSSLSADADQIEYRWFAHYAKPKTIMEAYARDPHTNFHRATQAMIAQYKSDITYELTKDCNFAGLFGAGVPKFAFMLGMTEPGLNSKGEPAMVPTKAARALYKLYHTSLPEAKELLDFAMSRARKNGFVRTILGRRARFPDKDFVFAAVNRVIQGSAADEMKTKLVLLRRAKTGMVLRFCVHDEVFGDVESAEVAGRVKEVLNTQVLPSRVPLLWGVATGPNWQEAKKAA